MGSPCQRGPGERGGAGQARNWASCAYWAEEGSGPWGKRRGRRGFGPSGQNEGGKILFVFFLFSFLFQSFSKRDFKSFLEIEQNTQYKIKYASA